MPINAGRSCVQDTVRFACVRDLSDTVSRLDLRQQSAKASEQLHIPFDSRRNKRYQRQVQALISIQQLTGIVPSCLGLNCWQPANWMVPDNSHTIQCCRKCSPPSIRYEEAQWGSYEQKDSPSHWVLQEPYCISRPIMTC